MEIVQSLTLQSDIFRLFSVVKHHGNTITSGHYTNLSRDKVENEQWCEYSDAIVCKVKDLDLKLYEAMHNGYILFYAKAAQNSLMSTEDQLDSTSFAPEEPFLIDSFNLTTEEEYEPTSCVVDTMEAQEQDCNVMTEDNDPTRYATEEQD